VFPAPGLELDIFPNIPGSFIREWKRNQDLAGSVPTFPGMILLLGLLSEDSKEMYFCILNHV
jgi:hypothetical protein